MTPTAICLAWLRSLHRRSILEDRAHVPDLERLIRKVRQADAEETWAALERQGRRLPGVVDWNDIGF